MPVVICTHRGPREELRSRRSRSVETMDEARKVAEAIHADEVASWNGYRRKYKSIGYLQNVASDGSSIATYISTQLIG